MTDYYSGMKLSETYISSEVTLTFFSSIEMLLVRCRSLMRSVCLPLFL